MIAHRGCSGERPEHTRSAYDLAIAQGADFLEPDLVVSRDGVLVVRHENALSETTDVAELPAFAARRTVKPIDGKPHEDWFAEDFTLEELKTLRCRERLPRLRGIAFDGREPILTFEELLALAEAAKVGLVVELKHAADFRRQGLDLEPRVAAATANARVPILFESFEPGALNRLAPLSPHPRIQLIDAQGAPFDTPGRAYADLLTPDGLDALAKHVRGISVAKALLTPGLVAEARKRNLKVFAWTYRAENEFLPPDLWIGHDPAAHGDLAQELRRAKATGVDGVFCDFPALARMALE